MSKITEILKNEPQFIPAVVGFLVKGDQVLLIERKKTSNGLGEGNLAGVGGKVGDEENFRDETPDEALVRELQEEIGIAVTTFSPMGMVRFLYETTPDWNMKVFVYILDSWDGEIQETEVASPAWYSISELPISRMFSDNQYWLPRVLMGEKVDSIFLYDKNHQVSEQLFLNK